MPLIDIGDGRIVDHVEGALSAPPPPPPPPKKPYKAPKKPRRGPNDKSVVIRGMKFKCDPRPADRYIPTVTPSTVPHFQEWVSRRNSQTAGLAATGRLFGQPQGMTQKKAERLWAVARRKAKKDMKIIKEKIVLAEAAEEALQTSLEVMRGPSGAKDKLSAAKLVLDFTMAKPAAKQDITVNKAEEWLASLGNSD